MAMQMNLKSKRGRALQAFLSLLALISSSQLAAETLESFTLNATLIDASGPERILDNNPYCRVGGETLGITENWGTVTLSYDEAQGAAGLTYWNGTGATSIDMLDHQGNQIFVATFSFQNSGPSDSVEGFSAAFSESVHASYVNRSAPSFRGSYIEKTSTTDLTTGRTAHCEFKYQIWGGTGDVQPSEPDDPSLISIFTQTLKTLIEDTTKSKNTAPIVKYIPILGVRG